MLPGRPVVVRRRPLLRAAVAGGGAYLAGHAAASRAAQRAEREAVQDARLSDLEEARQPQPLMLGQLIELVRMHDAGALTEAEFSAAKGKLLG